MSPFALNPASKMWAMMLPAMPQPVSCNLDQGVSLIRRVSFAASETAMRAAGVGVADCVADDIQNDLADRVFVALNVKGCRLRR